MGKVEENKRLKLNSMLEAALQLFTDQGWNQTSISDIVQRSGVAKGTFYLYFKDKHDIRNKLVVYESRKILRSAYFAMLEAAPQGLEAQVVFIVDYILQDLQSRQELLGLISKNLSWGVLKREITRPDLEETFEFTRVFLGMTAPYGISAADSEIMLYLLVELVGASCYSSILYEEPCKLENLKPHLFETVRRIVRQFTEGAQPPEHTQGKEPALWSDSSSPTH